MLVFGQEFNHYAMLNELATEFGYTLQTPTRPQADRRGLASWLLVRDDVQTRPLFSLHREVVEFFGSYVAGVRLTSNTVDDIAVFSVHASPRPVPVVDLRRWPTDRPPSRVEADGILRELYYADLALAMLTEVAPTCSVLAAGDFNEARSRAMAWGSRLAERYAFGAQYFERLTAANLVDVTFRDWGEERRTLFFRPSFGPNRLWQGGETKFPFQSDHVIATPDIAELISLPIVDPLWSDSENRQLHSDHAPVWFKLLTEK